MSLQDRESVEDFDLRDQGSSPVRSATTPEAHALGFLAFGLPADGADGRVGLFDGKGRTTTSC